MKLKIIEEAKDFIKLEIVGETHTLSNSLRNELNNVPGVEVAGYKQDHPLVNNSILIVKTNGKLDPKKAINLCILNLKKKNIELLSLIKKL